jgi:hypothetical protein
MAGGDIETEASDLWQLAVWKIQTLQLCVTPSRMFCLVFRNKFTIYLHYSAVRTGINEVSNESKL